jgi:acetyl esterase/lipase
MKHRLHGLLPTAVLTGLALAIPTLSLSQTPSEVIPVWDGVAPGSEGWTQKEGLLELSDTRFTPPNADTLVWNVTRPTLTVFKPKPGKANGAAVIVAPGGGFRVLSYANEGVRVAQWLADAGVTAFVLKYRLNRMPDDPADIRKDLDRMMAAAAGRPAGNPPGGAPPTGVPPAGAPPGGAPPPGAPAGAPPGPLLHFGPVELDAIADGQQAVKLVRSRAKQFGIDPHRIGIIGFSAGGAVSGGAAVRAEPADRPNFVGVIYSNVPGVIPPNAPPAFFAAAADDPLSNAMPDLFTRWRASGAVAEIHIYAKGQHGFGTARQGLPVDHWLDAFHAWLAQQGFVPL